MKRIYSRFGHEHIRYPLADVMSERAIKALMTHSEIVTLMPFQSGKASFVASLAEKMYTPELDQRVVYVCSYAIRNYQNQMKADFGQFVCAGQMVMLCSVSQMKQYQWRKGDLIVFDEAHYGDKKCQRYDTYINRKYRERAGYKAIYLSATPFAAIEAKLPVVMTTRKELDENKMFNEFGQLVAAPYTGIWTLLEKGCLVHEMNLIGELQKMKHNQYALIRCSKGDDVEELIDTIRESVKEIDIYKNVMGESIDDVLAWTKKASYRPRVMIVKNKLSMGERIDCTNLAFAYDDATLNSSVDTRLQGFDGRLCGFNKPATAKILTNIDAAKAYIKAWEQCETKTFKSFADFTVSFSNSLTTHENDSYVVPAKLQFFPSTKNLPPAVKKMIRWDTAPTTRSKNKSVVEGLKQHVAMARTPGVEWVQTQSYFGEGSGNERVLSQENKPHLMRLIRAFEDVTSRDCYYGFQAFLRAGNRESQAKNYKYAVFFIMTDQFASLGYPKNSCFLLTKIDNGHRKKETRVFDTKTLHGRNAQNG